MRPVIILCCFILTPVLGCGEDPPPASAPEIISAKAVCRDVQGVPRLVLVSVHVRDLNGIDDILDPVLIVEANRMFMAREVVFPNLDDRCVSDETCGGGDSCQAGHCLSEGAEAPEVLDAPDCQAGDTGCDLRLVWERSGDSEQIFCGLGESTLQVRFNLLDASGRGLGGSIPIEYD